MSNKPLYPHVPKVRQVMFPHVPRASKEPWQMTADETLEQQIKSAGTIEQFPLWVGKGFRVDIENWGIPRGATVADVVRYEIEELGNEQHLSPEQLSILKQYPAHSVMWVAKNKEAAAEYLSEGMTEEDITEYDPSYFGEGARIIDLDYQDGYLVMYGPVAPTKRG